MKKFAFILSIFLMLGCTFALTSCSGGADKPKIEKATDKNGPEYTSQYLCPMSCKGSGSAQPGKCPACGMAYVKNAHFGHNHGAGGHNGHDHGDHKGHDHGDHSGHNH